MNEGERKQQQEVVSDDKRKKLVWKYFWGQKWDEIKTGFQFIGIMILILSFAAFTLYLKEINTWALLILYSILLIFTLIYIIYSWLKSNWKKANDRVEEEFGEKTDIEDDLEREIMEKYK